MKPWISWSEWVRWTEMDQVADEQELMMQLRELGESRRVQEFIEVFVQLLTLKQLSEVNASFANPRRDQRIYPEALLDMLNVLNSLQRGK